MSNDTAKNQNQLDPIMQIEQLSVSFPGQGKKRNFAVNNVNLTIYPRQTLAVVGESGSGKSVSAMSILQIIPTPPGKYEHGKILWQPDPNVPVENLLDYNEKQMQTVRGNQIAMIFQEPMTSLNPVYTIGEQIIEAVRLHRTVDRAQSIEIAIKALSDVGIADPASRLKEYPHQLSGGMRQRVMIAMALACEPKLLLADEPTTALDVTIQAQILELLRHLQDTQDMSIMLITHDLGVVAENADVVAVMYAGRVLEFATVENIFERPLHPYTRGLLKSMPVLGQSVHRLPTVVDGATIPEDFPAGYHVEPHVTTPDPEIGYGGKDARLYEVEPEHWVLCTPASGNPIQPSQPGLRYRRVMAR
ncbi:Oligopeptide transport ATP-binding protein OppD [Poriferisphaera corsica]|uniref:Oligopeptide transport ATP-binding protein OppD n=1 Tax=Poriferisphaera corsica TaxID=2528020 RepID=A0A517YWU5_9BACT|nr:ABC transporter ATP-binding protein [Poriferisphaera corsica]QDU34677.1 Oligopeptide transport ATP-binding protein OppD [Poriferisphaera corsica]